MSAGRSERPALARVMATDVDTTCSALVELVTDYLERALDPAERARVDVHLARCDGCAAYLDGLRTTIALAGRIGPDDLPPELVAALLAAFDELR